MNDVTRSTRISTALQVIQHANAGLSVSSACKVVGLPRSSYYAIINRERDAIAEYQSMVVANSREELLMILAKKNEVFLKLLQEALAESTSPRDRLAIYKSLTEMQDKLIEELRIHNQASIVPLNDFSGPVLQQAKSRFTTG